VSARRSSVASRLVTSSAALAVFAATFLSQAQAASAAQEPSPESAAVSWTPGTEVLSLRDRWGSTVQGATQGTYLSTIYSKPRNFQAADGTWQPIDLTMQSTAAGFRPTANDLLPVLALTGHASQLVDVSLGGAQRIRFGLAGALPVPGVASGSSVRYPGILPGVDARFDLRSGGVKETLVLHSADGPTTFDFPLNLTGLSAQSVADGSINLLGNDGTRVASIPAGAMTDSLVNPASGDPAESDGVAYQLLPGSGGGTVLHVTLDSAWLHDPARVFPVQVDPSIYNVAYSDSADDAYVQSTGGYSDTDTLLKSGTFDGSDKSRSFMHFQGVNTFDGRDINSATLNVWENWSYSCTTRGVRVYPISASWVGTTPMSWPGVGVRAYSSTYVPEAVVAHGHDSGCPAANVGFNVTTTVSNWASNAWPNYGLALISTSETDAYGWKKWDSNEGSHNPSLTVNWTNTAPKQVSGRTVTPNDCSGCTGPTFTRSTSPDLHGSTTDADALPLRYDFEVYPGRLTTVDASGNATPGSVTRVRYGSVSGLASGATATWTVAAALGDGDYSYRVRAYDGELYGVWSSGWVQFTVDSGPPVPPTITSNSHPNETNYYSAADIQAQWQTLITPPSGTKGYTTLLDTVSGSDPGTSNPSAATSTTFTGKPDGCYYLHTRATNNVSTWSDSSQREMCVDTTAPTAPTSVYSTTHNVNTPSNNTVITMTGSGATDASSGLGGYSVLFNTSSTSPADTVRDVVGSTFTATSTALADGTSYYFHVRAIDLAGNAGSDVVSGPYLIDTLAPASPTVTSSQATSSAWTPNTSLTFTWAAPSDASGISGYSAVFDDIQNTIPPASNPTTATSASFSGIGDGTHYFHLRALDGAGNWGSSYLFTLLVDSSAPVAPTVSSSTHPDQNQWSTNNLPSFTFSGSDLSGVTGFSYVLDQSAGTVPGTTVQVTGASATYTAPSALPEGLSYFHVRARNGSNLFGDTYSYLIRVDRTAPNVAPSATSTSHQVNTPSNNQVLQLAWTSAPGSDAYSGIGGYSVAVNTSSGTAADTTLDLSGTTYATNLSSEGSYYFHIRALDKVGNIGPDTVLGPFVIDLTGPPAPSIASTSHTDSVWSSNPNATFALASSDASGIAGYGVVFDETAGTIPPQTVTTSTGIYTKNAITDGTHYLHVRAKDLSGNWSGASLFTVLVDSTAPSAPAVSSSTHPNQSVWSTNNNPGFSFSAGDTSGITGWSYLVDRAAGTVPDTTVDLSSGGSGTASFTNLADGLNYFHIRAVNGSGLFGAATTYVIKVDRSAPNVAPTVTSSSHQISTPSNNTSLVLSWTGAPGADAYSGVAGYSIAVNTSSSTPADSSLDLAGTSYSYSLPGEGSYYVHIRTIDAVGNVGPDTVTGPFVIDLTSPDAPVIGSSDHTQSDWSANPTATFTWSVPVDPSGISGYAVLLDQAVATVPLATVNTSTGSWTASGLPEGVSYLHVRARDLAGNWGQPSSFALHIDLTAPDAPTITSSTHATPGAWSTDNNPQFGYAGTDLSGIAGYAYTLDQNAGTDPASTVQDTTGGTAATGLADGLWYLHVRAINGAGLPGAVATYPIGVDRSAPTAPTITSLTHEPDVITSHRVVTADWTEAPAVDSLSGVAGYSIAINNDPATPVGVTVDTPGTEYTGTSLADGTWWLHARAIDNVGNAGPEATLGPILIDASHGLPYPVQDVLASASNGAAAVQWSPVDDNGSPNLGYVVVADPGGMAIDVGPATLTATFTGLENGTAYTFSVQAHNANGDSLPSDPSPDVVPEGQVGAPTDVTADEVPLANAVHVAWTTPELNGQTDPEFTVTLSPGGYTKTVAFSRDNPDDANDSADVGTEASNETTLTNIPVGVYTAAVTVIGQDGTEETSAASDPVSVNGALPAAPNTLTATPGDTQVDLTWPPAAGNGSPITDYEVVNQNDGSVQYVEGSDTSTTISGLTNGILYTFEIFASNELGQSPTSTTANATPFDAGNMAAVNATTPSNVRATRGDQSARLTWTPPKVFVAGTTKYRITSHPKAGSSRTWDVPSSPATVSGLTNGVPVSFTIATLGASTGAGDVTGPESNSSNKVTPAGLPGPASHVSATGADSSARVIWDRANPNGESIRDYVVRIYTASGSYVGQRKVGSSPQQIRSLSNGSSYYFTVQAENAVGAGAISSNSPTVLVAGAPTAPTNVTANQSGTSTQALVSWTASSPRGVAINGYVITSEPGGRSASVSATSTSGTVNGLRYGVAYTFTVRADSSRGKSPAGTSDDLVLSAAPDAPTRVQATAGDKRVTITWAAGSPNGSRLTGFTIAANPPYNISRTIDDPDARSVTIGGLTNGSPYTFYVSETNRRGNSTATPSNSVTPKAASTSSSPPPSQPSGGANTASAVRSKIVHLAIGQDQEKNSAKEHEWPNGGNCNWFSSYWNREWAATHGTSGDPDITSGYNPDPCTADPHPPTPSAGSDTSSENWCSDFSEWVYKQAGINISGADGLAADWMNSWGKKHDARHPYNSEPNYRPRIGDLAVWGHHVAVVVAVDGYNITTVGGNDGPNVKGTSASGKAWEANVYVYRWDKARTSKGYKGHAGFLGFVSPTDSAGKVVT
jgi:hypothetical protein